MICQSIVRTAVRAQLENWRHTVARYDSEPDIKEGRNKLREEALDHAVKRDKARAAYHHFEYGSAAFQLAIVLASAAAVTSMPPLAVASGGLGLLGAALTAIGCLAPTAIHLQEKADAARHCARQGPSCGVRRLV